MLIIKRWWLDIKIFWPVRTNFESLGFKRQQVLPLLQLIYHRELVFDSARPFQFLVHSGRLPQEDCIWLLNVSGRHCRRWCLIFFSRTMFLQPDRRPHGVVSLEILDLDTINVSPRADFRLQHRWCLSRPFCSLERGVVQRNYIDHLASVFGVVTRGRRRPPSRWLLNNKIGTISAAEVLYSQTYAPFSQQHGTKVS